MAHTVTIAMTPHENAKRSTSPLVLSYEFQRPKKGGIHMSFPFHPIYERGRPFINFKTRPAFFFLSTIGKY